MTPLLPAVVGILGTTVLPAIADGPPLIIDPPLTQFVWAGRSVTFKVTHTNKTALAYHWQSAGVSGGEDIPCATNQTYSLRAVTWTNNGIYRVILSNAVGVVTSAWSQLIVSDWPTPTGASFINAGNLDARMRSLLFQHDVPGASLAIVEDGRLVDEKSTATVSPQWAF